VLERILPPGVTVVSTTGERSVDLYPEEEAAVGNAVEKRRREFVTARACAREALAQLGLPAQPIPAGPRGEPVWPQGVVCSITH
jgi:4'-phosphopantetheinyl transferase EntD